MQWLWRTARTTFLALALILLCLAAFSAVASAAAGDHVYPTVCLAYMCTMMYMCCIAYMYAVGDHVYPTVCIAYMCTMVYVRRV